MADSRRWVGPVAGIAAAAVALGVAELVAVFAGQAIVDLYLNHFLH